MSESEGQVLAAEGAATGEDQVQSQPLDTNTSAQPAEPPATDPPEQTAETDTTINPQGDSENVVQNTDSELKPDNEDKPEESQVPAGEPASEAAPPEEGHQPTETANAQQTNDQANDQEEKQNQVQAVEQEQTNEQQQTRQQEQADDQEQTNEKAQGTAPQETTAKETGTEGTQQGEGENKEQTSRQYSIVRNNETMENVIIYDDDMQNAQVNANTMQSNNVDKAAESATGIAEQAPETEPTQPDDSPPPPPPTQEQQEDPKQDQINEIVIPAEPSLTGRFKTRTGRIIEGSELEQSMSRLSGAQAIQSIQHKIVQNQSGSFQPPWYHQPKIMEQDQLNEMVERLSASKAAPSLPTKIKSVKLKFEPGGPGSEEKWEECGSRTKEEQIEALSSLYSRCLEIHTTAKEKLAEKYLQPLVKGSPQLSGAEAVEQHMKRLQKQCHGVGAADR